MTERNSIKFNTGKPRSGVALLLTLAVLIILTTVVYTLSSRLTNQKRRRQYMINYQAAKYACDSAMKYAVETAKDIKPELITRENVPDFSDLFYLTYEEEKMMLEEWAQIKEQQRLIEQQMQAENGTDDLMAVMSTALNNNSTDNRAISDPNSNAPNSSFSSYSQFSQSRTIDANDLQIPGPYGPPWPYVTKPVEFEIGDAKITINVIDENAKMPLIWAVTKDKEVTRAAGDALEIFCELMQLDYETIDTLKFQLEDIKEYKEYSKDLKPIKTVEKTVKKVKAPVRRNSKSSRSMSTRRTSTRTVLTKKTRPAIAHTTDFARLLHSSMIDLNALARPLPNTGERKETALKYLALWGSQKVNINTAPRHVLAAAFTFGGDAFEIAQAIIEQRKVKPFKSIEEFRNQNYGYSDSIKKAEPYITTKSTFFAIEVKAECGNAIAKSTAAFHIKGNKAEKVAVLSDL